MNASVILFSFATYLHREAGKSLASAQAVFDIICHRKSFLAALRYLILCYIF